VAVCGQLNAMRQPSGQIVHKMIRRARVTAADKPARHKFRVRVERKPTNPPRVLNAFQNNFLQYGVLFSGILKSPSRAE
jgi:hypothetical protein